MPLLVSRMTDEEKREDEKPAGFFEQIESEWPIYAKLGRAHLFFSREQIKALMCGDIATFARRTRDVEQVMSWFLPPGGSEHRSAEQLHQIATNLFRNNVIDREQFDKANAIIDRPSRGAPARVRVMAQEALELRVKDARSWTKLTKQFCDCGETFHSETCKQTLRSRVRRLQKFISHLYSTGTTPP
jgi:hypothetical protein